MSEDTQRWVEPFSGPAFFKMSRPSSAVVGASPGARPIIIRVKGLFSVANK